MQWLKRAARWLVLWPLWERMPWSQRAKMAAAGATGAVLLLVVLVAAAVAGGGGGSAPQQQPQVARQVASPAPSPALASQPSPTGTLPSPPPSPTPTVARAAGAECIPTRAPEEATLARVVDGDTIDVSIGGRTVRVRYIGVNTPERDQPYYQEATDANRRLLGSDTLLLYKDTSETDQYGRLLRYVVAGDRFVNLELVRQGYAQAATYPPDVACSGTFVAAEREARNAQLGLWAPAPQQPAPQQPPQPAPPASPARSVTLSVTSPVSRGGRATAQAQAWAGASCDITYVTPSGSTSTAQGLGPKTAGPDGTVSWTWVIGSSTRPGTGSVTVVCDGAQARASIVIQ